jgi:hypothetical protein
MEKYHEKILQEKNIIHAVRTINKNPITKAHILPILQDYTMNDLFIIHSAIPIEIEKKDYHLTFFSFGSNRSGVQTNNGEVLQHIIKEVKEIDTSLSKEQISSFQERIKNLYQTNQENIREDEKNFIDFYLKNSPTPIKTHNYLYYLSEKLKFSSQVSDILKQKFGTPLQKEEVETKINELKEDFLYLLVPFSNFENHKNLREVNIAEKDYFYSQYYTELKELQEKSNYRIIFLFLTFDISYIPNFFKSHQQNTNKTINQIFLSPIKEFEKNQHTKVLFSEFIYEKDNELNLLNFFNFEDDIKTTNIKKFLQKGIPYKEVKKSYYEGFFFDNNGLYEDELNTCTESWDIHTKLKFGHHAKTEKVFHDLKLLDIRTEMPFYLCAILNKLHSIKSTFKNQKLDFLFIDDEQTFNDKHKEIDEILTILLGKNFYELKKQSQPFDKDTFTPDKRIEIVSRETNPNEPTIRNTNFILLDFHLDPKDKIFFGSDYIEQIEKTKKAQDLNFRSWYFITSHLSSYVNKFEIDKAMYEYYDTATVHMGDSTDRKFKIFFMKKLIYFIYSKVNIFIRLIKIIKSLKNSKQNLENEHLIENLVFLIKHLLQQVDLLELRYTESQENKIEITNEKYKQEVQKKNEEGIKLSKKFYTLVITVLENKLQNIEEPWEVKEIKLQQLKAYKKGFKNNQNEEIQELYKLIETIFKEVT